MRVRALFRGRRCRWRPRRHRVRVCAALGGRLSLCPPLVPTVFGRGCGGRRAASPFWRPLCAEAAAFRSLPTRRRTVRGPAVAAAWFFPRRVRSQKRSAGAVCGSSAVCADARWASVTIIPCARHPARVRGRRALGPYQRLHHEHLGPRRHHLNLYTLLASVHCRQDRRARIVKTRVRPRGGRRRRGRPAHPVKARGPRTGGRDRAGRRARPAKARALPNGGCCCSGRRARFIKAFVPPIGGRERVDRQARPVKACVPPIGVRDRVGRQAVPVKACVPPLSGRARVGRRARPLKSCILSTGSRRRSGRRARFVKAWVPLIGGRRPRGCEAALAHASRREVVSHRRAHLGKARPVPTPGRQNQVRKAPLIKAHLGPPSGRPRRDRQAHLAKVYSLQPGGRRPNGRQDPEPSASRTS